jgi:hypothetical protein
MDGAMTAMSPGDTQRLAWQPPPRPDWVQRINDEGAGMDIRGVVPLDERSLLDAAMRSTGLSDFGDDDWREPFQVFISSLEQEAQLNLLGRIRTRQDILQLLEARLMVEDAYKRHPEIADERIEKPIMVVGQGRTGTSFLINLLAADPENGALRHWEVMFPSPPPETASYKTDPRIERADHLLTQWSRVTPTFETMHEWGATIPMECLQLVGLSFRSAAWLNQLGQVPSFEAYMAGQDIMPGLHYMDRVLKLLQWRNPRRRWVLKDVFFLSQLPNVLKLYPDVSLVWAHRDPVRALASMVNMIGTLQWARTDRPFSVGSFEFATDPTASAALLGMVIDQLDSGAVPADRIFHLQYQDLVHDPVGSVASIYEYFGIELTAGRRAVLQDWLAQNPRDSRPPHRFSLGSDAAVAKARTAYQRYQRYFAVPSE